MIPVLIKNVIIEEAQGRASSKDASKFYGSAVLKYRDPDTKLKSSLPIKIDNLPMVQQLQKYEKDESLVDVTVELKPNNFAKDDSCLLGNIIGLDVVG